MKINLSYKANPGLRMIDEIADGKVVWIKGYNGIGKSLAAKMLEIISGSHVFDNQGEFKSLMQSLDEADITIKHDDGKKIIAKVQPKKWVFNESMRMIEHESVGNFYENDKIISAQQFRDRFEARIIHGNESLPTQISTLITHSLDQFRTLGSLSGDLGDLSKNFRSGIMEELQLGAVAEYDRVKSQLAENEKNIEKNKKEIENFENDIALISKLMDIQSNIQMHNDYGNVDLSAEIKSSEEKLKELESNYRKLQDERNEHSYRSRELILRERSNYDAIINSMRQTKGELERLNKDILDEISELEIELFPEEELSSKIRERLRKLREEEERLDQEKKHERLLDEVLTKQSQILNALTNVEPDLDISNEIIAHGRIHPVDSEIDITVNDLENMIKIQENALLERKRDVASKDYARELERISDHQRKLENIRGMIGRKAKVENEIKTLDRRLRSLVVSNKEEYDSFLRKIEEIDGNIRLNRIEVARIDSHLELLRNVRDKIGKIPLLANLVAQRDAMAKDLNIAPVRIDYGFLNEKHGEFKGFITLRQRELRELESNLVYLRHKKTEMEKYFERQVQKIRTDQRYAFLQDWLKINASKKPAHILRKLAENLDGFVNTIGDITFRMKDIRNYHEELLRLIAQRPSDLSKTMPLKNLEEIFNNRLKEFYNDRIFMQYVFEGFNKIESFDLRENQINLTGPEGFFQARPITSFSTGQKAFAFSMAMMSLVFRRPSENRVLFLDEFGALLDYVREDILMEQVKEKVLDKNVVQKIVILLPVRERPEEVVDALQKQMNSTSKPDEIARLKAEIGKFNERLSQLKHKGYYQEIEHASG